MKLELRFSASAPRTRAELGAFLAGVAAAVGSYLWFPSVWLALFVGLMAAYTVAGLADAAAGRQRVRRALHVVALAAGGAATVYATYQLSGRLWLAVLLGLVGGAVVQAVVDALLRRVSRA